MMKGTLMAAGAALLLMVAGCTSTTTGDAAASSPDPSLTATAIPGEAAFGEWVTLAEGVTVMVLAPREFTPSEDVYAAPLYGPVELDEWEHFVRTTVIIRNEPPGVAAGDPAHAYHPAVSLEADLESQEIVDEASGIAEREYSAEADAGQQIAYDVAWGVDVDQGIDFPEGIPIHVKTRHKIYNPETVSIVFGS